jgi:DNA-binding NarL/FixJ family response regulator
MFSLTDSQEFESDDAGFSRLTVLIADDHAMVREGMKLSLEQIEPGVLVLEAESLDSAIETYRACGEIDLVLLDLSMPGALGSTALERFAQSCPEARIVVVSATYDMGTIQAALRKGVLGFIPKMSGKSAFLNALRFILEGGIYVPPEALLPASAAAAAPQEQPEPILVMQSASAASPASSPVAFAAGRAVPGPREARLTTRQIDVLAHLLDGKPNKQICRELNLAMGTVKCHIGAILGALEVNSRAEAIAAADKRGWREWLAQPRAASREPA